MSAPAGTPRSRLATAVLIATAAIAALAVIGSTPAPAPAIPGDTGVTTLTDLTTDGTTTDGGTTGTTTLGTTGTTTIVLLDTLAAQIKGPGQISGDLTCSTAPTTPDTAAPVACASKTFSGTTSFTLTAAKHPGTDHVFSHWEGGSCNGSTVSTCTLSLSSSLTVTAVFEDNTAPTFTVASPATDELFVKELGQPVSVVSSSPDAGATPQCAFDGAVVFSTCQVVLSDTSPTEATPHSVSVRYRDPSGNVSGNTVERSFRVYILDTTIAGPTGTVSAPPEFTFGSTKQGSTFVCSVDGDAFSPCTSPYTANLPNGDHTFAVKASHPYDGATRVDATPASRSFTIARPHPNPGTPGSGADTNANPVVPSPLAQAPGCKVPKLKGKTLRAAKKALTRAGCKPGKVRRKRSAKVGRNRVLGTRPKAGSKRPLASRVVLIVSRGRR